MKRENWLLVMSCVLVILGFAFSVNAAEIVDQGYCGGEGDGTNLTWTLETDGMLTIEGSGEMTDLYKYGNPLSSWWQVYFEDITSARI